MTDNGEFYGVHYYEEITDACTKISGDIERYIKEADTDDDVKPVVYWTYRIKSPESLKKKLIGRNLEPTYQSALDNGIHDIVGFRIICAFQEDVYSTAEWFKNNDDYDIIQIKDYIKTPKPNGYRSLHLIVRINTETAHDVYAEIQIRTIAMDTWATLEHKLKYKKDVGDAYEALTRQLKKSADDIASIDLDMSSIRDMLRNK